MTTTTAISRAARFYDGRTPDAQPARAWTEPDHLVVSLGSEEMRWRLDEVVLVDRDPVKIEIRGERTQAVLVDDPGFLTDLKAASGIRGLNRVGGSGGMLRFLLAIGALAVVAVAVLWMWGIPLLAAAAAGAVPPGLERKFGAMVVADMVPPEKRVSDPAVTGPVERTFALLVAHAPSQRDSFQVMVARDPMVNAFAAPGGYVVVTSGLLSAMAAPDEMAAVMAHEITHVVERHSTRQLFARLGARTLIAILLGDQGMGGAIGGVAGTLGELSHSRGDESEADAGAVRLLARAGIEPAAMDRALERIAASAGRSGGVELAFLSTHPSTPGRRARVRKLAAEHRAAGAAALPDTADWSALREAVAVTTAEKDAAPR